jgi:hypothetical protein
MRSIGFSSGDEKASQINQAAKRVEKRVPRRLKPARQIKNRTTARHE